MLEQPMRNTMNENADHKKECVLKNRKITILDLGTSLV
jgi:hypothetical protein